MEVDVYIPWCKNGVISVLFFPQNIGPLTVRVWSVLSATRDYATDML